MKQYNHRVNQIATIANMAYYDLNEADEYIDGAPHIKHETLRTLYGSLIVKIFDDAFKTRRTPKVLDLGAGEGSVTLPFLELGCHVTAVDISHDQLDLLRKRCQKHLGFFELRNEDLLSFLKNENNKYDIIIASSLLHHIPDYFSMIDNAINLLEPEGVFFSFQDPMRYDTLDYLTRAFSQFAYLHWRLSKGDIAGGTYRSLRRLLGIYNDDSIHDNTEYHFVRNGVDQNAIRNLLSAKEFQCDIISYFSTQSPFFQYHGERLNLKNYFAIIAKKRNIDLSKRRI